MDVSCKKKDDFEKYYQNEYKNIISHYYEFINEKKKKVIIPRLIACFIFCIILIILKKKFNINEILGNYDDIAVIIFFVIVIFSFIYSIKKTLDNIMFELNETIVKDIIAFICDTNINNVRYEPKLMVSKDDFSKLELFNLDVVNYSGRNFIKTMYNKNTMVFSDMETYIFDTIITKKEIYKNGKKYIKTIKKKKKRIIFKGVYIGATLNKKISNHIYLIPNNLKDTIIQSKIMNYISYHGVQVNLENLDFTKKYKVFCDDEVQARYILSLSLMERVNKLDELYNGKKYIVFKQGKRFAICIEGISIDEIKKIKLPFFRNENREFNELSCVFSKFNNLFKIYHILDLGNDLYTKI